MANENLGITFGHNGSYYTNRITSFNWTGISRNEIPTWHFGTTNAKTTKPSPLYDPGSIQIEGYLDPAVVPSILATGSGFEASTGTLTLTDAGSAQWAAPCWMSNFDIQAGEGEQDTMFSATLRVADDITITP